MVHWVARVGLAHVFTYTHVPDVLQLVVLCSVGDQTKFTTV
jgi:hypothetical protein